MEPKIPDKINATKIAQISSPTPELNVGFEKLFFQNLPDFNIEIRGGKGLKFLSGSYRFCLGKKLHKNSEKKVKVRYIWKTLYLQLKTEPPWSHPLKTYAQTRKWGVNPNTYNCLQARLGGRSSKAAYVRKKNFFGPQILKIFLFFVQKKLLHCHLLLCIEICKPALSYK